MTTNVSSRILPPGVLIPNNQQLEMLHYIGVLSVQGEVLQPNAALALFRRNGWAGGWVNGVFPFHHYHARSHEVLGNTGDPFDVQFGGPDGPVVEFGSGDAVVLPAGTGHCRVSSPPNLLIVGAYPSGQEDWDLKREDPDDHRLAMAEIPRVPLPTTDPVIGGYGPLMQHWRQR